MEKKIHPSGGENQAAGGDHRSSKVDGSGLLSRNQRSQRNIPHLLAGKKIHGFRGSPRRRVARRFTRRKEKGAIEPVGSAFLTSEFAIDTVVLLLVLLSV